MFFLPKGLILEYLIAKQKRSYKAFLCSP